MATNLWIFKGCSGCKIDYSTFLRILHFDFSPTFLLTRDDIDYLLILQEIRVELRIIQLAERSDATPASSTWLWPR
jgi:hypothetical protein